MQLVLPELAGMHSQATARPQAASLMQRVRSLRSKGRAVPCRFLDPALPAPVLVPALLSYGQLARLSRENYPVLAQVLLPR